MIEEKQKSKGGYKSGPKAKLSDDKIIKIVADIEALETISNAALQKIADNNGVSISTVYRYGREFGILPEAKKRSKRSTAKTKKKTVTKNKITRKKKVTEKEEKGIIVYRKAEYGTLLCGMFAGRHEMPEFINKFIFNKAISNRNLFNFDMLDTIVDRFIKDNFKLTIDEDGIYHSDKEMVLYLTGLSSALASIIKLTAEYNINLTLMHYNNEIDDYFPQKIWDKPIKSENPYINIIGNYTTTTWYRCNYDDIKTLDKFYIVQVVNFSSKNKNDRDADVYIYMDEEVMWKQYYSLLTEIMSNRNKHLSIFVKTAHIENDKIKFDTVVGRASNFDYYGDNK